MCQNPVIWYFLEKGRDMDLFSTFTTRFAAGRHMGTKVDDFSSFKPCHAKNGLSDG
jgi:hypothetical protein